MGPEKGGPEVVCQSDKGGVITSGGGFSTYFAQPAWQKQAVTGYLSKRNSTSLTAPGYNQNGRGFPDISLLSVNYQVFIGGALVGVYGTSAAAPVFAGMVTLLNTARKAAGMSNVGFINPTLYQAGANKSLSVFHDVASGHNKCCSSGLQGVCCSSGFSAIQGWDPVSGWGGVDFAQLATVFNVTAPVSYSYFNKAGRCEASPVLASFMALAVSLLLLLLSTGRHSH
jgi:tripeptidyl-peptidase-1